MNDDDSIPPTLRSGITIKYKYESPPSDNIPGSIDYLFSDRAAEEFMNEARRQHQVDYFANGGEPSSYKPTDEQIFAVYERIVQKEMVESRRPGSEIVPLLACSSYFR